MSRSERCLNRTVGTRSIPIIDVGADGAADAIDRACREVGFFGIVGHGVPDAVVDHAWSAATRFFDLPLEDKLALAIERDDYPYGYSPLSSEVLGAEEGADAADLNESFSVSPPPRPEVGVAGGFDLTYRLWPSRPGDFAVAWAKYYEHMAALADRLLALCAAALHLESGYFVPYTDRHVSALRALNYPPQESPPVPGQIRAGAHTDYGTITILRPGAATGGLCRRCRGVAAAHRCGNG